MRTIALPTSPMAYITTHEHLTRHADFTHLGWAVAQGIAGGFVAGVSMLVAEVCVAWLALSQPLLPLRMVASVPLQVLPSMIPGTVALTVGIPFHLLYAIMAAVFVALIIATTHAIYATRARMMLFAALAGFLLWILNFVILSSPLGVPWFATDTSPTVQIITHTIFFGAVLGFYLDLNPPRDRIPRTP